MFKAIYFGSKYTFAQNKKHNLTLKDMPIKGNTTKKLQEFLLLSKCYNLLGGSKKNNSVPKRLLRSPSAIPGHR